MRFEQSPLAGVILLHPEVYGDERGFFLESWNQRSFSEAGFDWQFVQDNHSRSSQGTLRGLHFQTEHSQGKLVRVAGGAVFDVIVDLRRSSPSFGKWYGAELSADNHRILYLPPGCAHGFYVLSETADFLYKTSDYYHPGSELCLLWNDTEIAINWPLLDGQSPLLSAKDAGGLSWSEIPFYP